MPERYERLLRILCVVLGAALLVRVGWVVIHHNPLAHLRIPSAPTLPRTDSTPVAKATNNIPGPEAGMRPTNVLSAGKTSNASNSIPSSQASKRDTNTGPEAVSNKHQTNVLPVVQMASSGTNAPKGTNAAVLTNLTTAEASQTNPINAAPQSTNSGTNSVSAGPPPGKSANTGAPPNVAAATSTSPQKPGAPGKAPDLRPELMARVDRVTDSEILGPVMRPLPMALLGIAGNVAFLRAPNGQTGLVKEGEDLGSLKLLRIGTNRVLVEEEGQKKELMMFSGFGGESLLPK